MQDLISWNLQNDSNSFECAIYLPDKEERQPEEDDFFVEFDPDISKADRWDYIAAAASGILTGALDMLWRNPIIAKIPEHCGRETFQEIVLKAAQFLGCKEKSIAGALQFLQKKFIDSIHWADANLDGKIQGKLMDFARQPNVGGLFFSIVLELTGWGYRTDADGNFVLYQLSDLAGKNTEEKILFGVANWLYWLIFHMSQFGNPPGKYCGIPKKFLSIIKDIAALPFFQALLANEENSQSLLQGWLEKLLHKTKVIPKGSSQPVSFDLQAEINLGSQITLEAIPILLNECLIRSFYMMRTLYMKLQSCEIQTLSDLTAAQNADILPWNNRPITRMLSVSSGIFLAVSSAASYLYGHSKKDQKNFLLHINHLGVVRFVFACKADAKYMKADFENVCRKFRFTRNYTQSSKDSCIRYLTLTPQQARILYSLEADKIQYDILFTQKPEKAKEKQNWFRRWKDALSESLKIEESYFLDRQDLYAEIRSVAAESKDNSWLYLLGLELSLFLPYGLYSKDDKPMKLQVHYEEEVFCKQQTALSSASLKSLMKAYHSAEGKLQRKTEKALAGAAAVAVVGAASAGLAFAFAPQLAVALVGHSFAGIYGAALTNASLAALGFGSLASGGLGMAGGAAILAGGGALLGAASSGALTLSTAMLFSSKNYACGECAKLIALSEKILLDRYGEATLYQIMEHLSDGVYTLQKAAEALEENEKPTDADALKKQKKLLKETKGSIQMLKRCIKLLQSQLYS